MTTRARVHARGRFASGILALTVVAAIAAAMTGFGADAVAATAKKSKASTAKDPGALVLAHVGKSTITRADFETRLSELPPQFKSQFTTPEQKRQFLDRMIEERVWLETALDAKVDKRPEIQKQLEAQRRDVLIRTYLGETMQKAPAPSDSLIESYYNAHPEEFMSEEQVKVRQIQLADEKTAKQVQKELAKGGDFAALAKKYSKDSVTKDKGGDLGAVTRNGFFGSLGSQKALADSAFAAPVNSVRGPIKTAIGWHLIEVTEKIPAAKRPLEEVKQLILRQVTQQANQDFYQQSLAGAKATVGVTLESAAIDSTLFARKSPIEMFREAGEVPNVDDRVAAYRKVYETYPESDYAPQALFMVGFVESEEKQAYDQAEAAFRELIAKYPSSELSSSAHWMLENMRSDKTPDFELPGGMGEAKQHDSPSNTEPTPKAAGKP